MNEREKKMWDVKVTIKWSTMTLKTWEEKNEDGEMETGTEEVWSKEETIADLRVKIDHTEEDENGPYLPDDEVTYDSVYEAVEEWQNRTGLHDDDTTELHYYYDPEKGKRVK